MKWFLGSLLAFGILSTTAHGAKLVPCAQIDTTIKDTDGMPFCPDVVKENSAFAVFRCALQQANSFHNPTEKEKAETRGMLNAWKDIREGGTSSAKVTTLLGHAATLNLQACRVKNADDSYLLVYTKPGIKNYSGAFFMLRETKASRFIVLGPHDDSDSTFASTKYALSNSKALAVVSNGHMRGNVPLGSSQPQPPNTTPDSRGGKGDWSHETEQVNLGTYGVRVLSEAYKGSIWLMVHGMKNNNSILYRIRNPEQNKALRTAYEKATAAATGQSNFNRAFNADFHTEKYMSNQYIKVEYPAAIHRNRPQHLAAAIREMETYPWAWDANQPPQTPEPEPTPTPDGDDEVETDPELEEPGEGECGHEEETPPEVEPTPEVTPSPAPPVPPVGTWSPGRRPQAGKRDVICVAVKYASGPSADAGRCKGLATNVARFYTNQSRGRLVLTPKSAVIQSNLGAGSKGAGAAADAARRKYPNALILLPNLWYKGSSHAGQRVAWLTGYANSYHETGHLLGLGHCGRYVDGNMTKGYWGKLDSYGGGGCVMSGLAGSHLDPRQYLHNDWLEADEWDVYYGPAPKKYQLRKISTIASKAGGLMTVVIPNSVFSAGEPGGRDMYVAYSDKCQKDPCMAIYLAQGGGSQRVGVFGKEFKHGPSGLTVKNLGLVDNKFEVEISVVPPKP